jgi:hypothetical protein
VTPIAAPTASAVSAQVLAGDKHLATAVDRLKTTGHGLDASGHPCVLPDGNAGSERVRTWTRGAAEHRLDLVCAVRILLSSPVVDGVRNHTGHPAAGQRWSWSEAVESQPAGTGSPDEHLVDWFGGGRTRAQGDEVFAADQGEGTAASDECEDAADDEQVVHRASEA